MRGWLMLLRAMLIPLVFGIAAIKFSVCDDGRGERGSEWPIASIPALPGLSTTTFMQNGSNTRAEGWIAVDTARQAQDRFNAYVTDLQKAGWRPEGSPRTSLCRMSSPTRFRCFYTAERQTATGPEELTVEMAGLDRRRRQDSDVQAATVFLHWRAPPWPKRLPRCEETKRNGTDREGTTPESIH